MHRKGWLVSAALLAALLLPLTPSFSGEKPAAPPKTPLEVTYYFLPG